MIRLMTQVLLLWEWDEFIEYDWKKIFKSMKYPKYI